ncbi:beta-1,3-glucanase family protein [Aquimarina sp. M1]
MNSFIGIWTDQKNTTISITKVTETTSALTVSICYNNGRGPFTGVIQTASDQIIVVNFSDDTGNITGTLSTDKSSISWSNQTTWKKVASALAVTFKNNSGLASTTPIHIGFFAGTPPTGQAGTPFSVFNTATGESLSPIDNDSGTYPSTGNWYTLTELSKGVTITSFSGRIYVCYNTPWSPQYKNYEPGQAVTDPNFFLRYDKMEMTFTGNPNDVADLTSIDYWSIPMTLNTYLDSSSSITPVQTVSGFLQGVTAVSIYDKLKQLTTPTVSGLAGPGGIDGKPLPALVPGDFKKYPKGPTPLTSFARIIGPSSYPPAYPLPGAIPVTPYDLFHNYLTFLHTEFGPSTKKGATIPSLGKGVIATIQGKFAGVGPNVPSTGPQSKQTYDLTATIDDNLDILLTGSVSSVTGTTTILYKSDDLMNPEGIYGGNTPYHLNGSTAAQAPGNDVYGWIGGDLFSGFSIGALGSSTNINGTMAGAMPSQDWFTISSSYFFSGLQPNNDTNYNRWAATLSELSNAYNFAFTDRFAHVLASLNPATIDTLEIELLNTTNVL